MLLKGESRTSRRSALRLLGLSAGAALLAACSTAPSVSAPTTAPQAAPTTGGAAPTLRGQPPLPLPPRSPSPPRPSRRLQRQRPRRPPLHNLAAAVSSSTPFRLTSARSTVTCAPRARSDSLWLAFDRLTQYDEQLQPQPMLAESWDLAPDYTKIQINLRKGVTFHTGQRVHQRRRQMEPAARAPTRRCLRSVRQSEQLVHGHRHARQIHGRAYL